MDYVEEAKKFIQRAVNANHPDVMKEHLRMADWCLCQEVDERNALSSPKEPPRQRAVRSL
jgi:hypothetical protein